MQDRAATNLKAFSWGSVKGLLGMAATYYVVELDSDIQNITWAHVNSLLQFCGAGLVGGGGIATYHRDRPNAQQEIIQPAENIPVPRQFDKPPIAATPRRPMFDDVDLDLVDFPEEEKKTVQQVAIIDLEQLYEDLERDEGVHHSIYKDSRGYKTAGIGHLLTKADREYSLPVGTKIAHERVLQWFETDVDRALQGVISLFPELNSYPMDVRLVLTNMIFQLGYTGLSRFKKTRKFIEARQWAAAADEMMDSRWAEQTPNRAQRHSDRLKSIPLAINRVPT